MKQLILVRHGESEWNKMNLFTGWTDVDLTETGRKEAYEAGKLLKAEGYRPQFCFTSYLKRAVRTLNQVLEAMDMDYLPVEKSWRLNEKSYGAIQGLNKADTAKKYGDDQVLLWRRSFDVQPPALDMHDERSPRMDPRYAELSDSEIPLTESLKDTIARLMPYYGARCGPWQQPERHCQGAARHEQRGDYQVQHPYGCSIRLHVRRPDEAGQRRISR